MKVRESQIPEESGKAKIIRKSNKDINVDKDSDDDDDKKGGPKFVRPMIYFIDIGLTLSLFEIESVEKTMLFLEKPKPRWNYGITINKDIEPSIRVPKTNIEIWYEKEEQRDKRYQDLLNALIENGVKLINI